MYNNTTIPGKIDMQDAIRLEHVSGPFWNIIYKNDTLIVDKDTGYYNASRLDSSFSTWFETESVAQWLDELRELGTTKAAPQCEKTDGGKLLHYSVCGETFVHRDIVLHFASSLSLRHLMHVKKMVRKYEDCDGDLETVVEKQKLLIARLMQQDGSGDFLPEDVTQKPTRQGKRQVYAVFAKNNPKDPFPYVHIRTQKENYPSAVKKILARHPKATAIYYKSYVPNPIHLGLRVKEMASVQSKFNQFKLKCTESRFLTDVEKISSFPFK